MGIRTEIAYADSTCNPMVGCDGCELLTSSERHCYAAALVRRYAGAPGWPKSFDKPILAERRLETALKWPDLTGKPRPDKPWLNGYPRIVFLCDLGDPFTESLPIDWLAPWLPRLADSPHIWLLLTKRPGRLREFAERYPLPGNIWPGTTITSGATAWRAAELLQVPGAAVRWLSLEPLLGEVDLLCVGKNTRGFDINVLTGWRTEYHGYKPRNANECAIGVSVSIPRELRGIDWVVAGGESGPGARPMHPDWARKVRDDCAAARVPFMFKQWGEWAPGEIVPDNRKYPTRSYFDGRWDDCPDDWVEEADNGPLMYRVGKRAAGHLLDGREWMQMPEVLRG